MIKFLVLKFTKNIVSFQVAQRNVPGIDCAYLAMDTEEGVEVVWNEVQFSERKSYKAQEVAYCLIIKSLAFRGVLRSNFNSFIATQNKIVFF